MFFALFNGLGSDDASPKEAAAVIKISSSRMATQSERLGYEFAKHLGVQTPQVVTFLFYSTMTSTSLEYQVVLHHIYALLLFVRYRLESFTVPV